MSFRQNIAAIKRHPHFVPIAWGVAIFALAIGLRSLWVAYVNMEPGHDGADYWFAAKSLANGHGFREFLTGAITARLAPGWPLVLSAIIFVFGPTLIAAKALNIVIGSATAVLVYVLGSNLRDRRTGIVAGGVMAIFPSQVYFTTTMMNETFFVLLATTLVLCLALWLVNDRAFQLRQAFALGLVLGIMSLVRAESVVLAPTALVLIKVCGSSWRKLAQYSALLVAGMLLIITPWTIRNYVRFDKFILVRQTSARGPLAPIRAGLSPDFELASSMGGTPPTFSETYDFYRDDPSQILRQVLRKFDGFYGSDNHFQYFMEPDYVSRRSVPALPSNVESRWAALGNGVYYVVAVAALVGTAFWFTRRDRGLLIILWFTGCWSLIFLASVPLTRYHFAIIPMIALLGAVGLVAAWDWLAEHLHYKEEARTSKSAAS